jgi:hypothetical protein
MFVVVAATGALLAVGSAQAASSGPALAWSGTSNFGTIDGVGGQTASQTFTLTNSGGSATGTLVVALTNTSGAAFSITRDSCTGLSLGPKKSCKVTVEYAPTTSGESDSTTLTATGEHANASITLTGKSGTPDLTLSPGTRLNDSANGDKNYFFDFGAVASTTQTFTVTNDGSGTSNTLHVSGGDPHFVLSNSTCDNQTLAPSGTCTFAVAYTAAPCSSGNPVGPAPVDVIGSPTVFYIHLDVQGECP